MKDKMLIGCLYYVFSFRCFYIAQSYHNGKKLNEAIALYEKVITYVNSSLKIAETSSKTLFKVSNNYFFNDYLSFQTNNNVNCS